MSNSMRADPMKWRVILIVLSLHLLFLVYASISYSSPVKKAAKPLVVKTITPKAAPKEKPSGRSASRSIATPVPAVKQTPKKEKEAAPVAKKVEKKIPPIADKKLVKKKEAPKKSVEESRDKMSQKLLRELEESLSKLEEKPAKKGVSKAGAKSLPPALSLELDSDVSSEGGEYDDSLIGYLKQALNLPEYGEVKIQLTLKQDGTFVNLVVIKAESEKNRKYLEASLPHLRFPHLVGKKKQETFIVTFCNEI